MNHVAKLGEEDRIDERLVRGKSCNMFEFKWDEIKFEFLLKKNWKSIYLVFDNILNEIVSNEKYMHVRKKEDIIIHLCVSITYIYSKFINVLYCN